MFVKGAKENEGGDDTDGAHVQGRDADDHLITPKMGKKNKWRRKPHQDDAPKDKDKDIPPDWKVKCHAHASWCEAFLTKLIREKKEDRLFAHGKRPKLTSEEKERVTEDCKAEKSAKQKEECTAFQSLTRQLWEDHNRPKMGRSGRETTDSSSAVWMVMSALLLLLLGGVSVYFYLFGCGRDDKMGKGGLVKGTSKAGKLKSRRSRSGKSTIKSRLGRSKIGGKSRASK